MTFWLVEVERMMAVTSACKDGGNKMAMDNGKYVRYTPEQVEALERLYHDCPKPSSLRRQQLIRECPILSNIEPKQIKVWFQNRRYINKFQNLVCLNITWIFLLRALRLWENGRKFSSFLPLNEMRKWGKSGSRSPALYSVTGEVMDSKHLFINFLLFSIWDEWSWINAINSLVLLF